MNAYVSACFDVLKVIAPSLVSVLFGAFIFQRFFVSRANEAALVDFLIRELEELRDDTLEYWNLVGEAKEDKQRQSVLAQKITGNLKALNSDVQYFCGRYCCKSEPNMKKLLMHLHDSCTGGDFESKKKRVDTQRYIIIVNAINEVKSELLRRKL